jgi:hypothetical protein
VAIIGDPLSLGSSCCPPPKIPLVGYHGVFAPRSFMARALVTPTP